MDAGPTLVTLSDVLARACEADVRKRYQTAEEFHADLEALQKGESPKTRSAESVWKWLGALRTSPRLQRRVLPRRRLALALAG